MKALKFIFLASLMMTANAQAASYLYCQVEASNGRVETAKILRGDERTFQPEGVFGPTVIIKKTEENQAIISIGQSKHEFLGDDSRAARVHSYTTFGTKSSYVTRFTTKNIASKEIEVAVFCLDMEIK